MSELAHTTHLQSYYFVYMQPSVNTKQQWPAGRQALTTKSMHVTHGDLWAQVAKF